MPAAAVPEFKVSVDEPPEVTLVGLTETVEPDGAPETVRLTVCAEPLVVAVLIVEVPPAPCVTVTVDGLAEIEKSLGGGVAPQFGNLNVPTRVLQLKAPVACSYWLVYQKVQPSTGSTAMLV